MTGCQERGKKILVIDDDPGISRTFEAGLRTIGYTTYSAVDPQDGLQKARELKPDLIILDVVFPGASGYDVLEQLKKDPLTADIPVIMLTVKNFDEDVQKGLTLGVTDYVIKPVHMGLFLKRIQNILAKTKKAAKQHKIVIIDDEINMTLLLKIELESEGYEVSVAGEARKGIALIGEVKPDLILLDVMMPDMNGYEVLTLLKQNPPTKAILVIMLTAKGLEDEIQKGLDLGADEYIPKPFHPGLLIKRIQTLLAKA